MHILTAKSKRSRGLIALFSATSLVLGITAAYAADGSITGSGAGTGFETGGEVTQTCPQNPLFGTFPGSRFELSFDSVYTGVAEGGLPVAAYEGPVEMNLTTGPYVINPEGTYENCITPGPVPIHGSINSPGASTGGAGISCGSVSGLFQRRDFDNVQFVLDGECTLKGNLSADTIQGQTTHTMAGVMHPCRLPVPPFPDPGPELCPTQLNADSFLTLAFTAEPSAP